MEVIGMEPGVTEEEVLEEAAVEMEEPEEEETLEVPDVAVNAQENLALTEGSCSSMNPCGECIGDCDYDNQCDGEDLECYPRRVGDISPVPGKFNLQKFCKTVFQSSRSVTFYIIPCADIFVLLQTSLLLFRMQRRWLRWLGLLLQASKGFATTSCCTLYLLKSLPQVPSGMCF